MVLLYGQPVIQMESWLEIVVAGKLTGRRGPAMIRRNTSDVSITTCFRFSDSIDTQSISKHVHIRIYIYHEWPYRVEKISREGSECQPVTWLVESLVAVLSTRVRFTYTLLSKQTHDRCTFCNLKFCPLHTT